MMNSFVFDHLLQYLAIFDMKNLFDPNAHAMQTELSSLHQPADRYFSKSLSLNPPACSPSLELLSKH
jgi:hypothetical protein